jgi:hypothetical protein
MTFATGVTQAGFCVFAWWVFGPQSWWRGALCVGLIAIGSFARYMRIASWNPALEGGSEASKWAGIVLLATCAGFLWCATEALSYHRLLRRRISFGLADPVVVNRFFVWGAGSAGTLILLFGLAVMMFRDPTMGANLSAKLAIVTLAGLMNAVTWGLTFSPPEFYLAQIRRRAEAAHG